jgi:PAS domain-containing protein
MKPVPKKRSRDYGHLQQIIVGLTDGVILVGIDQRILWANDAALGMHGVRRIKDLGATVGEYRRRFRLRYRNKRPVERGRYPIERVIASESFNDVTVEMTHSGKPDRCWVHSIRSLVITDDSKEPDYLVLIIKDETERFEAEERFESAFSANPAPAIICRLSDLCFVRVNEGFLKMTGYDRNDLLGSSIREIDFLAQADNPDLARERLKEGRTIDPRKNAENALRQSEERFEKSFRLSPVPAVVCKLERFKLIEINEAFRHSPAISTRR